MIKSSKANKQRFARFNASMHIRQHFAHAHISKDLRQKLGVSTRSIQLRRGDTIKIMAGSMKGKTGKVHSILLRNGTAEIEGITRKDAKGKEKFIPISISNLYIIDMDLSDKRRSAKLKISASKPKQEVSSNSEAQPQVQEVRA
ncbi:MAG: 50S ribosomal protein L24 [Candidatus Micrarchaeaceae archaeon]